jgi:hypothetical protein
MAPPPVATELRRAGMATIREQVHMVKAPPREGADIRHIRDVLSHTTFSVGAPNCTLVRGTHTRAMGERSV